MLKNIQKNRGMVSENPFQSLENAIKPIFIVYSEDEANKFQGSGYNAIFIQEQLEAFIDAFRKQHKSVKPLILTTKQKATFSEKKAFQSLSENIWFITGKRPFTTDRDRLLDLEKNTDKTLFVEALDEEANKAEKALKEQEKAEYIAKLNNNMLEADMDIMNEETNTIKTGFSNLDGILDGGLRAGLYVLGAISSIGKTTFALQIANHIAEQGGDVMFFSMEQSGYTLRRKNLSRHTYLESMKADGNSGRAKTASQLSSKEKYKNINDYDMEIVRRAEKVCYGYKGNIKIVESINKPITIDSITDDVAEYIRIMEKTPVIFIDYLQLLTPADPRRDTRAGLEYNVKGLRELVSQFNTPVFVISSIGRAFYRKEISMEAFKESGLIEFSSDVLIGLQYQGIQNTDGDTKQQNDKAENANYNVYKQQRAKNERNISLLVLKNRMGKTNEAEPIPFQFLAKFCCYKEEPRVNMKEYE